MKSVNRVFLLGTVGRDPEFRETSTGSSVAKFSLATNERYKDRSGEWKETTTWHNITCWGRLAEIARDHVCKGKPLYVEGSIRTESWPDKQTGEKKYRTEIVISDLVLLGGNGQRNEASGAQETGAGRNPGYDQGDQITDDDLPF